MEKREIASWAVEIKRSRRRTAPWHYVNIPITSEGYDPKRDDPDENHVIARIESFELLLKDKSKPKEARAEALKFLVHLVAICISRCTLRIATATRAGTLARFCSWNVAQRLTCIVYGTPFSSIDGGAFVDYDLGTPAPFGSDQTTVSGPVTLSAATLNINALFSDLPDGSIYTIIAHPSGTSSGDASSWVIGKNNALGYHNYTIFSDPSGVYLSVSPLSSPAHVWAVDAGGSWSSAGNWSGGAPGAPGANAFFHGAITADHSISVNGAFTLGHISFDNAHSYTLAGDGVSGHGITMDGGGPPSDITAHVGSHFISAPITMMGSTTFGVAGGATLNVSGTISGPGPLVKTGPGILFLSGSNVYGGTTINAGAVSVAAEANLGLPLAPLLINQATLDVTSSFTTARPILVGSSGSTIHVTSGNTFTISSGVGGSTPTARVLKSGPGKLVLGGTNIMGGGVTISQGTLSVSADENLGAISTGSIIFDATAGLSPTLQATSSFATGRSIFMFNFGLLATSNCGVDVSPGKTLTISSSIFGGGFLQKTGGGTLLLSSASGNTFGNMFAGMYVDAGRVIVTNSSGTGTGMGVVTVHSGGSLGGSGSTGATIVGSGGHLVPGASPPAPGFNTLSTFALALSSGANLDFDLSTSLSAGGSNDLIAVTAAGPGTLTLAPTVVNLNAIDPSHDLTNGTYTLITYSPGSLVGTTSGWSIGSSNVNGGHSYSFSSASPGMIQLIVSPGAPPQWNVDASGSWSVGSNWSGGVPSGAGATANFGTIIMSAKTVTVDGTFTVGKMTFSSAAGYTIADDGVVGHGIALDNSPVPAGISVTAGSRTISAPLALTTDAVVSIGPAASKLTITNLSAASSVGLTKSGAGTLLVNNVRMSTLAVSSGTVGIITNGSSSGTSHLTVLSIAGDATPTATLDLDDNDLIVTSGDVATVTAQLFAARHGGAWDASGITSVAARTQPAHATALGLLSGSEYKSVYGPTALFDGFTIAPPDLLIKYTWNGDTDFNGKVDGADYARIDTSFNNETTQGNIAGWFNADFDYNGKVDGADYALIDSAFNSQTGELRPSTLTVPEPSAVSALTLMALCTRWRRSRRH